MKYFSEKGEAKEALNSKPLRRKRGDLHRPASLFLDSRVSPWGLGGPPSPPGLIRDLPLNCVSAPNFDRLDDFGCVISLDCDFDFS